MVPAFEGVTVSSENSSKGEPHRGAVCRASQQAGGRPGSPLGRGALSAEAGQRVQEGSCELGREGWTALQWAAESKARGVCAQSMKLAVAMSALIS